MTKEEVMKMAFDSVVECDEDMANQALLAGDEAGIPPLILLTEGFGSGIKHLGDLFGRGEIFLPELIFSTEIMKLAANAVEAKLGSDDVHAKGKMVIGTVEGDVHDIGKGIVAALVKSNGIEVFDLGREVPADAFVQKVIETGAGFVGSSALLTTTMTVQKEIEKKLEEAGLRDKVKTLVGGAPVTKRWADRIGADCYCEDASDTVEYILAQLEA
jgi:trimethylamine corrinoid protein